MAGGCQDEHDEQKDLYYKCEVDQCWDEEILDQLAMVAAEYHLPGKAGASHTVRVNRGCEEVPSGHPNSRHLIGLGVDFQTSTLDGGGNGELAQLIASQVADELGEDYIVDIHDSGNGYHMHIQFGSGQQ